MTHVISEQMLSILVGHNNLCDYCKDADANSPETFNSLMEQTLDILKAEVPRLFINLISPLDVTELYVANQGAPCFVFPPILLTGTPRRS